MTPDERNAGEGATPVPGDAENRGAPDERRTGDGTKYRRGRCDELGHGRLNALRAVLKAREIS